jgi:hypothetical protein
MQLNIAIYIIIVFITFLTGLGAYRRLSAYMKVILALVGASLINDMITFMLVKNHISTGAAHHIFSVVEISLTASFFILILKPEKSGRLICVAILTAILLAFINARYFESIEKINLNVLLAESFCITIVSLYTLYRILVSEQFINIFKGTPFLFVVSQLLLWSGSFFYWSLGIWLIKNGYNAELINNFHIWLNIMVYTGIMVALSLQYRLVRQ